MGSTWPASWIASTWNLCLPLFRCLWMRALVVDLVEAGLFGFNYGIDTIQNVSKRIWRNLG